jgi:hypothetical protein
MKISAIAHYAYVALLAAKLCSAELRLEISDPYVNLTQPTKGDDTPKPDEDDYIEGLWPPQYPANNEMWKDFICKGDNIMKAMQASDADVGRIFKPEKTSAQSEWTSAGT